MSDPPHGFDEVAPLRRVLLRRPQDACVDAANVARQWRALGYCAPPDPARAAREHEALVARLEAAGAEVELLPPDARLGLDAVYVRDAALVAPGGMIVCAMGKPARAAEPGVNAESYARLGLPVLGGIGGAGRLEGGDVVWLDPRTVAVGRGYRTNDEGIRQLGALLGGAVEVIPVPLPHWRGPADVFHLMSMLSPLDRDLALVYSPLLPVPFRERLLAMGIGLVEVAAEEFATLGCNVLALAPRRCLMLSGNPATRAALEAAGVEVVEYEGREISLKGGGGPTCLTRPLRRG